MPKRTTSLSSPLLALTLAVAISASATADSLLVGQPVNITPLPGSFDVVKTEAGDLLITWSALDGTSARMEFVPANQLGVRLAAEVVAGEDGSLRYRYVVENLEQSRQSAQNLIVEVQGPVFDLSAPQGWYVSPLSFHAAISFADTTGPGFGIEPGQEVGGFAFSAAPTGGYERYTDQASGKPGYFHRLATLPGIVTAWVRGDVPPLTSPEELPPGLAERLPGSLEDAVVGETLGPVAIEDDRAVALVERLRRYLDRSSELGWIGSSSLLSDLREGLNGVEDALSSEHADRAIAGLRDLLARLDVARSEDQVSTEAWALLHHNGVYLQTTLLHRGGTR